MVIPAYNEQGAVRATVDDVRRILDAAGVAHEITVVNDGSSDGTLAEARASGARVLNFPDNIGYGHALKAGIAATDSDLVAILDADGTYPPSALPAMIQMAARADMVVGDRGAGMKNVPWIRRPAKWVLKILASVLARRRINDVNSGLRVFHRPALERFVHLLPDGYSFTTTITLCMLASNLTVAYHPIHYGQRIGHSKIKARHFFKFIFLVLRLTLLFQPMRIYLPLGAVPFIAGVVEAIDAMRLLPAVRFSECWRRLRSGRSAWWPLPLLAVACAGWDRQNKVARGVREFGDAFPPPRRKDLRLTWFLRLTVSGLVLIAIFRIVPMGQVWTEARKLSPLLWCSALTLFLAGHAAAAAKWRLLIGPGVSFSQAFQAHLAGLAANLCLPGVAGGDVVRAGLVFQSAENRAQLVVGSVADRVLDIFGLLIICVAGAFLAWHPDLREHGGIIALLAATATGMVLVFPASILLDRAMRRTNPAGRIGRLLIRAVSATAFLAHQPRRLLLCLAISMTVQATFVGINIALAVSMQVEAPTAAWFYAWSTAKIIAIAPISLGGLGVREAVMARLMEPFGVSPAKTIAIGLIWQTILYASGLIGVLAQVIWKPAPAKIGAPAAPASEPERSSST